MKELETDEATARKLYAFWEYGNPSDSRTDEAWTDFKDRWLALARYVREREEKLKAKISELESDVDSLEEYAKHVDSESL